MKKAISAAAPVFAILLAVWVGNPTLSAQTPPVTVVPTGDWTVRVETTSGNHVFNVDPPEPISVTDERYDRLPVFNEKAAEYARGMKLRQAAAQECPTAGAVDPDSIVVRAATDNDASPFLRDRDYRVEPKWGCVGRTENGGIDENRAVCISYVYEKMRIDSVVRAPDGQITLRKGEPHVTIPKPPKLDEGDIRLANLWIKAWLPRLTPDLVFVILETESPGTPEASSSTRRLLPRTIAKLEAGETLNLLAWGDSVTDAGYLPDPKTQRWQEQFVRRLREKYPKANIVLTTEAWGGRTTDSYRNEPPGSPKNYKEKVLDRKPDLVISEFVNDAWMHGEVLEQRYSKILNEFKDIGAEWIILTPHYVRTDWMGLDREREIDEDPRPYVQSLRTFAKKHDVALAEGSKRYGRLWRQGIPYSTLMMNNINHPDPFGMKLFADALMELFP